MQSNAYFDELAKIKGMVDEQVLTVWWTEF